MATLLASSLLPGAAMALPTNPDVVVIGAGAAGIAAAHRLIADGKSVVVVEAADRIGGRAYTESESFGAPFDHGCSWLQGPASLPHLALARNAGFTLLNHSGAGEATFVGDRRASAAELRDYYRAWSHIEHALGTAADDVAAASVIPAGLKYGGVVRNWIGPMDHSVDLDALSTADYNAYDEYEVNYLVREGLGELIVRHGAGAPVKLGAAVTEVDWSGEGVRVATTAGVIAAKACIVTVSTGVLASGAIRFRPALPDWKTDAIDVVPMGLLVKIALSFGSERFGLTPNEFLVPLTPEELPNEACHFLTFPFNQDVMIGYVGGRFGWRLSAEGPAAAIDFALEEVARMLGAKARERFVKGVMTDWGQNPLTLGAYSAAKPGHHAKRADLARPVGGRVFFAGEAMAGGLNALVSGAHLSGDRTAAAVSGAIDANEGCSSCVARKSRLREKAEDE